MHRLREEFRGLRADQLLTSPLFGLHTSRGVVAEEKIARYAELLGKESLNEAERHERDQLRQFIADQIQGGETVRAIAGERAAQSAYSPDGPILRDLATKLEQLPEGARQAIEERLKTFSQTEESAQ
jgi:hypothetical protein